MIPLTGKDLGNNLWEFTFFYGMNMTGAKLLGTVSGTINFEFFQPTFQVGFSYPPPGELQYLITAISGAFTTNDKEAGAVITQGGLLLRTITIQLKFKEFFEARYSISAYGL